MASSGSVKTGSYDGRYYQLDWSTTKKDYTNNSTTLAWKLRAVGGASSWYAERTVKVVIDGTTEYSKTARAERYAGQVASGSVTLKHNSAGEKSFKVELQAAVYVSSVNCTGSKTFTLDDLLQATVPTLSATSVDMGASVTIKTPRNNTSLTHDLAYFYQGVWVPIATGVATSKTWTVPAGLALLVPNSTSYAVTIRCVTKQGTTAIGTKTVVLTAKVPASVVPTITSVTLEDATEGLAEQFGVYVQSKSKVKATIVASGANGSTIKTYSSALLGNTYSGASWTSGLLTSRGTHTLKVKVTDSRGRTAEKTMDVYVFPYSDPYILYFKATRCDSTGAAADDGKHLRISWEYGVTDIDGKNTRTLEVLYKKKTEDTYESEPAYIDADPNKMGELVTDALFSTEYSYDVLLQVTDWFGATASYVAFIPSAVVYIDFGADGRSLGIGKVAEVAGDDEESNLLDVGWELRTLGGMRPVVLENGTDLNTLLTPNTYAGRNTSSDGYLNCPIGAGTFTLEILPGGDAGQLMQRLTVCSKTNPLVYERFYHAATSSGAMSWGDWLNVSTFGGRLLWSGAYYMQGSHTITLSEAISEQKNGIVLVFSGYENGSAQDYWFNEFFVSKTFVTQHPGKGHNFLLSRGAAFGTMGAKYLYISDTKIAGNDGNIGSGTGASGIVYDNSLFVLRYVIGV